MRIFHLLRSRNIVAIIVLLILISFIPCINSAPSISALVYDEGSLSGYVNDTNMDPIEGALVRVYFHGTYEENYSDSSGHYHVTNIPICWCMKNCTASKEGYSSEWVLLGIIENTTHDFVLTPLLESIFIIGRITNLTSQGSTISFEAVSIWCITFSPFTIHKYTSGEKVIISIEYTGLLTTRIVFALCGALI